ncbi:hypothetical protein MMC22_008534 [Lobaria immixta]|nr:hypothetical protein [Lobaria immixta]
MSDPDFRPNFSLPDWGQTTSKTRTHDEEDKENTTPSIDAKVGDTKDEKKCVATNAAGTPGRRESLGTKLGWSTTFTMDEDKRASLVFEALRRESVAAAQRKESMAIEASIEAQRKKSVAFASPPTNATSKKSRGPEFRGESIAEPGSPMDKSFTTHAFRSASDGNDSHHPSKRISDQEQRRMSIAGPDFGVRRDSAAFGRRPSQVDAIRRESVHHDRRPSYADTLLERGRLPGIADEEEDPPQRRPGDKDEAGNKIHRQGVWSRMLHWELDAANAEVKHPRRKSRISDSYGRRRSGYSDAGDRQERRESGYSSVGPRHERKRSEYERI